MEETTTTQSQLVNANEVPSIQPQPHRPLADEGPLGPLISPSIDHKPHLPATEEEHKLREELRHKYVKKFTTSLAELNDLQQKYDIDFLSAPI